MTQKHHIGTFDPYLLTPPGNHRYGSIRTPALPPAKLTVRSRQRSGRSCVTDSRSTLPSHGPWQGSTAAIWCCPSC